MSFVFEINEQAPVVGRSEIEITAAPEVVWDVLTTIDGWPSWNPAVKSASLEGVVEAGSKFRWKAGPGTIRSTIKDVERPWRIAWSGTSFGLRARHVHTFEPREGRTLVRSEESFDGLLARLFRRRLEKTMDSALENGLRHLKAEAERQVRAA
jgi:hypothetical protein